MNPLPNDLIPAFSEAGQGPTVLLIHGYPLDRALWAPQLAGLQTTARVIAPDLPGFGGTPPARQPYSIDLLAQACKNLLDYLGLQEPVIVGGLSMGGYITFAFQRLFPERVAGLMLAATRPGADGPEARANREKAIQQARQQGVASVAASMLPKLMSPKTFETRPDLVAAVQEMTERVSLEGMTGALQAMRDRPDSTSQLDSIRLPVLVVHGADDQLIPVREAENTATAIPAAELVVFADAGHLPNLEQASRFNQAAKEFIKNVYG